VPVTAPWVQTGRTCRTLPILQVSATPLLGTASRANIWEPSAAVAPWRYPIATRTLDYSRFTWPVTHCGWHCPTPYRLRRCRPMGCGRCGLVDGRPAAPDPPSRILRPQSSQHQPPPRCLALPGAQGARMIGPILPGESLALIRAIPVPPPTNASLPTLPPPPSRAIST